MGSVGRRNEKHLDNNFDTFEEQWPSWTWLRERLRKAGLEPTSARELRTGDKRSTWVVLAQPAEALVKHFELAPEVLVLCAPWDEMQANDIQRAEDIFREEVRVDPGFAMAITHDPQAHVRLGPVVPEHRRYLFVLDTTFERTDDPQSFLRDLLRETLGRRRLFDLRNPAAGPQFFGRDQELEALERDVLNGHCLGVFGLRKVGKTSLLRRLAQKLRDPGRDAGRVLPVEVDLLEIPFNRRNLAGAVGVIGRQLERALERAEIRVPAPSTNPLDLLVETVEHLERDMGARVLLILDEYEVLLGGRIPPCDGVELLTWLRGLAQGHSGGFSMVLVGRNSRLLAPARIEGADNPMYRFLRSVPLAGLTPEECRAMVRKIGGRMALQFTSEALDIIARETGGHPALARTLGDLVDQDLPTSVRSPAIVDGAVIRRVLPRFSREVAEDMRELLNASNDFDPRAGDYLVHLAHGAPWIGGPSEARIDDALIGYGILDRSTHEFRIGHLPAWLRENFACPPRVAHG
jgi:hypothetical protein